LAALRAGLRGRPSYTNRFLEDLWLVELLLT
jgi:hypothetical protein